MGKWDHRRTWRPKNYYRDQRIPSPPTYYETEFKLREASKNVDLPWEERFCTSVGLPWRKIVNAKKYMHCYDNVVKWDDSAGELAFSNAKQRFFEKINGIPTDDPQPDPDMYNNEIDWNPVIDLDLVNDLDLAYFNPDEAEKAEYINAAKKNDEGLVPGCIIGLDSKDASNNIWECDKSGNVNKTDGWDCANDNSINKNISDPWERGIAQDDKERKDDGWGGGGNSSWHKETSWGDGVRNSADNEITWEGAKKSWHWSQYTQNTQDSAWRNDGLVKETGWGSNSTSRGTENRQRGGYRGSSFGRGQWHNNGRGWDSSGGCRKREGSQQYTSSYKSARVQPDGYREGNWYRK